MALLDWLISDNDMFIVIIGLTIFIGLIAIIFIAFAKSGFGKNIGQNISFVGA